VCVYFKVLIPFFLFKTSTPTNIYLLSLHDALPIYPEGAWLEDYIADGGYAAATNALTSMTPEQVTDEVNKSKLRGLGGAGFPTARKWTFIPKQSPKPKYLVVNDDEGEQGTFKDRYILERDPHALLEGMIIAAYAIGSHKAYVYIRGEY